MATAEDTTTKLIPLRNRKGEVIANAIVDADMYDFLNQWKWRMHSDGYAVRRDGPETILMHRIVVGALKGADVDHVNRDRLDNRRENLRVCTRGQNLANTVSREGSSSQYLGVCYSVARGVWIATIRKGMRGRFLGHYADERSAALAYDRAAEVIHGEFGSINLPGVNEIPQRLNRKRGPKPR